MTEHRIHSGRIAAISDGVFAIAMTLLVLELKLPELEDPVSQSVFENALWSQAPGLVAWILSLVILCRLWISHHALLKEEKDLTPRAATMNFVFLGVVSFIPFPMSLISRHPEQALSVLIFSATIGAAGIVLVVLWRMVRPIVPSVGDCAQRDLAARHVLVWTLVTTLFACSLALVDPRLGILAWIVIPVMASLLRRWLTVKS